MGLAELFPDLAPPLKSLADRLVDLLPLARRHYYHRDQRGRWSIKSVLQTIASELAYHALDVQSGTAAQASYLKAIDSGATVERKDELRRGLLAYCERDTLAMKVILEKLVLNAALRASAHINVSIQGEEAAGAGPAS